MVYIKQTLKDFLTSQENTLSKNPQPVDSTAIIISIPSESSMLKIESKSSGFSVSGALQFNSTDFTNLAGVRMSDLSTQMTAPGKGIYVYEVSGMWKIQINIQGKPEDYIYAIIN